MEKAKHRSRSASGQPDSSYESASDKQEDDLSPSKMPGRQHIISSPEAGQGDEVSFRAKEKNKVIPRDAAGKLCISLNVTVCVSLIREMSRMVCRMQQLLYQCLFTEQEFLIASSSTL